MDLERLAEMIESVKVAPLRPGDVVVVRLDYPLSSELRERINAWLKPFFGESKVLVVERGVDIEVIRPETA